MVPSVKSLRTCRGRLGSTAIWRLRMTSRASGSKAAPAPELSDIAAIAGATHPLRLPHEKIATTYCDINGERRRSEEFFYVPLRLSAPFIDANRYESPADAWGDVGAASGPLYVALAVASAERGYARGPHVLAWTSSDGGTRAAVTLTLPPHCNGDR